MISINVFLNEHNIKIVWLDSQERESLTKDHLQINYCFMPAKENGTVNVQINTTYFIISKSFGSETLIFRAIFHER